MDDHWTTWQAEQAGTNHAPSIGAVLLLLAVVTVLLLALLEFPQTAASGGDARAPRSTVPACAQHWPPTCRGR